MFSREITPKLREALEEDPVVFLRGPRQAGKTTLAGGLKDGRQYHTLDDLATLAAAKSDPEAFVAGLADRVVIDEVQRVQHSVAVRCGKKGWTMPRTKDVHEFRLFTPSV